MLRGECERRGFVMAAGVTPSRGAVQQDTVPPECVSRVLIFDIA